MIKILKKWMKRKKRVASKNLLERVPTDAETASACMYWRHDFGLLSESDRIQLVREARQWLLAWKKVIEDTARKGGVE